MFSHRARGDEKLSASKPHLVCSQHFISFLQRRLHQRAEAAYESVDRQELQTAQYCARKPLQSSVCGYRSISRLIRPDGASNSANHQLALPLRIQVSALLDQRRS